MTLDKHLEQIQILSERIRNTWISLLLAALFISVSLASHDDSRFFVYGAETILPLVGVSVPTRTFFYFSPILLLAIYVYLHIYIIRFAHFIVDFDSPADQKFVFPSVLNFGVSWLLGTYQENSEIEGRIGKYNTITGFLSFLISFSLMWISVPGIVASIFWEGMVVHDFAMSLIGLVCLILSVCVGVASALSIAEAKWNFAQSYSNVRSLILWICGAVSVSLLSIITWERVVGDIPEPKFYSEFFGEDIPFSVNRIPLASADLNGIRMVPVPKEWQSWENWLSDYSTKWKTANEADFRKSWLISSQDEFPQATHEQLELALEVALDLEMLADAESRYLEYISSVVESHDLREVDLRNADLTGAFLPGVLLRGADLSGARLGDAQLQGAQLNCDLRFFRVNLESDFHGAGRDPRPSTLRDTSCDKSTNLTNAYLGGADLQGANLSYAEMEGAAILDADFQMARLWVTHFGRNFSAGANFYSADLRAATIGERGIWPGVDFRFADLRGFDGSKSQLFGSRFDGADLGGANFSDSVMSGSEFNHIRVSRVFTLPGPVFHDTDLSGARFHGLQVRRLEFSSAELDGASLDFVDCTGIDFSFAVLDSVSIACGKIPSDALETAVGNDETIIPKGSVLSSCWIAVPAEKNQEVDLSRLCGDERIEQAGVWVSECTNPKAFPEIRRTFIGRRPTGRCLEKASASESIE